METLIIVTFATIVYLWLSSPQRIAEKVTRYEVLVVFLVNLLLIGLLGPNFWWLSWMASGSAGWIMHGQKERFPEGVAAPQE